MRKMLKMLMCCFLLTVLIANTAFAYPTSLKNYAPITVESQLLPPSVKSSSATSMGGQRGNFFGVGDLTIINQNGKIRVAAEAFMKEPVDDVYMTIYLDREVNGKWSQVAYYDFEFHSKDYPEGLTTPGVDFTIMDQPSGYYYRLRGSYIAFLNGANEGFGPVTDGILIQ